MASPVLRLVEPAPEATAVRGLLQRRLWIYYLAVMSTVSVAYLFGPLNSGPVFNAIGISAVVAILVGIRFNRISERLPWYLFAVAQTLFVSGDVLAYNYERFFGRPLPYPSAADVLYLAFYPVLVFGLMLLIRRRLPGRDAAGFLDSLIITIGLGLISWVFLVAPYEHDNTLSLLTKLTSIAYPVMDILVLSVVVRLVVGGAWRETYVKLLLIGSISLLVTDSIYGWLLLHGGYTTGGLLDGGWIAFYLLLGAAALHPSARSVAKIVPEPVARLSWGRLSLLAAAALTGPSIRIYEYASGHQVDVPVISAVGALMYLLVIARMAGLMRRQEQSEARFSSLVRNSSDLVTVIGDDLTIHYVSPSVERVLGYPAAEVQGGSLADLIRPDDVDRVREVLSTLPRSGDADHALIEFGVRHRDGNWVDVESLPASLVDEPSVRGIVLNSRDVSERKAFERQLEHHAFYDGITGLANRALFRNRVTHALEQAERTHESVAVIFMDVDDFKVVNDSFGHAAGDTLLEEVGERLRDCLRASDTAARLGGDEFAILLERVDDGEGPADVADRITASLEPLFKIEGAELNIRASLGIAFGDGTTGTRAVENLLRNADVAMYMAKARGKSRCEVYEPTMHKAVLERLELKNDLRRALQDEEFLLHYQPLIVLADGSVSGFEALIRWKHPERGMMPPGDFIPIAEETGLIIPVGNWVLRTACLELKRLQTDYPQDPPLSMSINVSSRQLQWPGLVGEVEKTLEEVGLDPTTLTIEVTESVMMQDIELAILRLEELRSLGVCIAVDDFGAGYSSLSYIRRLPVDILKVDRSFIANIDHGEEELELAAAIIGIARVLRLTPVAEGVERVGQLEQLTALGCDAAQGFYFAKPAGRESLKKCLSGRKSAAA